MEVDYYQVLHISKVCAKKDISAAYLRALEDRPSPEDLALLDRALLVLRVSYLRYVYERHGEAGLREQRSAETITRGMKAIAKTRSKTAAKRQSIAYKSSKRASCSSSSTSSSCTSSSCTSSSCSSSTSSGSSNHGDSSSSGCTGVSSSHRASSHAVSSKQPHVASHQRSSSGPGDVLELTSSSLSPQQLEERGTNVTKWLDKAWRSGMMLPRASSSLKMMVSCRSPRGGKGGGDARKRGGDPNKPAIATELFPHYPSPIHARDCWDEEDADDSERHRNYSTRYFITRPHSRSMPVSNKVRSTSSIDERPSVVSRRVEGCLAPPRPILGGRRGYLQRSSLSMPFRREHPYSRRPENAGGGPWQECAQHQRHRYHLQRPLVHMTKSTPTCTMRVIIQK